MITVLIFNFVLQLFLQSYKIWAEKTIKNKKNVEKFGGFGFYF